MRVAFGLIAATAATPAAIAVLFGGLFYLQIGWFENQHSSTVLDNIRLYAMFSLPVAFFMTVAAGAPLAHRLAHLGRTRFLSHALLGALLGAVPFILFDGYIIGMNFLLDVRPAPDSETILTAARWAALGSWCGLWSAVTYWLVAIRQRASAPSRQTPGKPSTP